MNRKLLAYLLVIIAFPIISFAIKSVGTKIVETGLFGTMNLLPFINDVSSILNCFSIILTALMIAYYFIKYDFYKGFRVGIDELTISRGVKKALDNGVKELSDKKDIVKKLPKFKVIKKDKDMFQIKIQNSSTWDKYLKELNLSPNLKSYVIVEDYYDNINNEFVFNVIDGKKQKLTFYNTSEFQNFLENDDKDTIRLDANNTYPLMHTLLVGDTGSGKTYLLFNMIYQLLYKGKNTTLYICDPKETKLSGFLANLDTKQLGRVSTNEDEIVDIIREFNVEMINRKKQLSMAIRESDIDISYRDLGLDRKVLIIDEFIAFKARYYQSHTKKVDRDELMNLIQNIVLEGRELGFVVIIAMQKSDADTIPTAIRNNLVNKIVLGNADDTTYKTAFEEIPDIANQKFNTGDGIYKGNVNNQLSGYKYIQTPNLQFDMKQAFKKLVS